MTFFHRFSFAVLAAFSLTSSVSAQTTTEPPVTSLSMMVGQVRVFTASNPYSKVIIGQPEVADVNVTTDLRFVVTARKEGATTMLLANEQGRPIQIMDIVVVSPMEYQRDPVRVRSFGGRGVINATILVRSGVRLQSRSEQHSNDIREHDRP